MYVPVPACIKGIVSQKLGGILLYIIRKWLSKDCPTTI